VRLTQFSDYAIRLLMTVALADGAPVTVASAAAQLRVSRNHLVKVAHLLVRAGILTGTRGRLGGLTLKMRAEDIRLGELLCITEPDFNLAECFSSPGACTLVRICRLPTYLHDAERAFLRELDKHTLADVIVKPAATGRKT
jgi:Rrf2 family transcriptional regulator, nitric oxide-sensitive transcriptional repressor